MDAGYKGALGALLDVKNPEGIVVCRNAKLGQLTVPNLTKRWKGTTVSTKDLLMLWGGMAFLRHSLSSGGRQVAQPTAVEV